jgi:pimeloyl-ACP methyl ester carboxylesterase
MEDHLADVSSLLAALGVERTHVVGTSFGAALALVLAARHPERIGAVVAATVGPGGRPALLEVVEGWRRACERVLGDGDRAAFQRALEGDLFGRTTAREHPERLEALRRQVLRLPRRWFEDLRALLDTAGTTGLDASLPGVEAPVLVVAAGEDRLVPPDDAAWLAQRLPRGRLEVVPRSGHALVLERPDELARLAADFLGRHPLPD